MEIAGSVPTEPGYTSDELEAAWAAWKDSDYPTGWEDYLVRYVNLLRVTSWSYLIHGWVVL